MRDLAKTEPDIQYALQVFGEALKYDLNCHRVGKIVKFYPETLTCDVELLELKPNKGRLSKYDLLQGLPLMVYGGINTNLTFGDVTGAECLVHCNDRDIDSWFNTGEAYKPRTGRLHDFSDGFVSLRPRSTKDLISYEMDGTVLNVGSTKIKLKADSIEAVSGSCTVLMSGDSVTITASTVNVNGNMVVNGEIKATGQISSDTDVLAAGKSGKGHTHTGNMGNPTSPPN